MSDTGKDAMDMLAQAEEYLAPSRPFRARKKTGDHALEPNRIGSPVLSVYLACCRNWVTLGDNFFHRAHFARPLRNISYVLAFANQSPQAERASVQLGSDMNGSIHSVAAFHSSGQVALRQVPSEPPNALTLMTHGMKHSCAA